MSPSVLFCPGVFFDNSLFLLPNLQQFLKYIYIYTKKICIFVIQWHAKNKAKNCKNFKKLSWSILNACEAACCKIVQQRH